MPTDPKQSEADAIVAACEAWPTVSGYVPCHYKQGCGCEMVPARVRAAIAATGEAALGPAGLALGPDGSECDGAPTPPDEPYFLDRAYIKPTPPASDLERSRALWKRLVQTARAYDANDETLEQAVAVEFAAVRAEATAPPANDEPVTDDIYRAIFAYYGELIDQNEIDPDGGDCAAVERIVCLMNAVRAEAKAEERNDPLAFSKKVDAAIRSAVAEAKAEQLAALREKAAAEKARGYDGRWATRAADFLE